MKVKIKDFGVNLEILNRGIELEVHGNNGQFLGDLIINRAYLSWCKGKTTQAKGTKVSWDDFVQEMEQRS